MRKAFGEELAGRSARRPIDAVERKGHPTHSVPHSRRGASRPAPDRAPAVIRPRVVGLYGPGRRPKKRDHLPQPDRTSGPRRRCNAILGRKGTRERGIRLDSAEQTCQSGRMARLRSSYVCQNCGAITQRWQGKCESCGEWNTIIEEAAALGVGGGVGAARRRRAAPSRSRTSPAPPGPSRAVVTGIGELDRVAGGGFVPGSATLIGGEPGIGKSTLLIQACAAARAFGRARRLRLGRRIDRAGAPARRAARARRAPRCSSPRRPSSRTSWRRSAPATRRNSSSSIRSRPCGATRSNRRRARSARFAAPRRPSSASPRRAARRCCSSVT